MLWLDPPLDAESVRNKNRFTRGVWRFKVETLHLLACRIANPLHSRKQVVSRDLSPYFALSCWSRTKWKSIYQGGLFWLFKIETLHLLAYRIATSLHSRKQGVSRVLWPYFALSCWSRTKWKSIYQWGLAFKIETLHLLACRIATPLHSRKQGVSRVLWPYFALSCWSRKKWKSIYQGGLAFKIETLHLLAYRIATPLHPRKQGVSRVLWPYFALSCWKWSFFRPQTISKLNQDL